MFVKKEITIDRPINEVFAYVLDFTNLFEWDDHVVEGQRVDLGIIKVGSKFNFIYSLAGNIQKIQYTLESLEPQKYLRFKCEAQSFKAVDEISFASIEEGTQVTYQADINVQNRVKDLLFSPIMDRIGNSVVAQLKAALEEAEQVKPNGKPLSLLNMPYRFTKKGWNNRRKDFSATRSVAKTILVTGPTSGLGKSATFRLAGLGCNLILVGRSPDKLKQLKQELVKRGFDRDLFSYTCDMEDIPAVQSLANEVSDDGHKIDVLINNAGALFPEPKLIDGIERTTVVDLVAPWVLTCNLLPSISPKGCVINVSSGGMYSAKLNIDRLKTASVPFSGSKAYAVAKRAMDVFSSGLNDELKSRDIRVHCMHPGWADTPGVLNSLPGFHKLTKRFLRTPFQGADTIVWLAMHNPESGGKFWLDRQIQPRHVLASTEGKESDYTELRKFLDTFAKPNFEREST